MHVTTAPEPERGRALARLQADLAKLAALDPDRPTAAERLEQLLGSELAATLRRAYAPCSGGEAALRHREGIGGFAA
jgi:hypothetical protein